MRPSPLGRRDRRSAAEAATRRSALGLLVSDIRSHAGTASLRTCAGRKAGPRAGRGARPCSSPIPGLTPGPRGVRPDFALRTQPSCGRGGIRIPVGAREGRGRLIGRTIARMPPSRGRAVGGVRGTSRLNGLVSLIAKTGDASTEPVPWLCDTSPYRRPRRTLPFSHGSSRRPTRAAPTFRLSAALGPGGPVRPTAGGSERPKEPIEPPVRSTLLLQVLAHVTLPSFWSCRTWHPWSPVAVCAACPAP
jgi:hypothetical protein